MIFPKPVKVKICGITNLTDARAAVRIGADYLGFVFYPKSPRYILPQKAKLFIAKLPRRINKVGVFVNEEARTVKRIAGLCGLDVLQFHGNEGVSYCRKFPGYQIIKAFRIKDKIDLRRILKYYVDGYLLDTYCQGNFGGTGKNFDWELLRQAAGKIPFLFLSGGLNSNNVAAAIRKIHPFAVDVSSGIESRPGKKSPRLLKEFFAAIRNG
ncbi:MAG: phosphoribosylanthranilate isomerase [Candidatus Omnitrophota bacterium]